MDNCTLLMFCVRTNQLNDTMQEYVRLEKGYHERIVNSEFLKGNTKAIAKARVKAKLKNENIRFQTLSEGQSQPPSPSQV